MSKQKKTTTKGTGRTKVAKKSAATVATGTTKLAQLETLLRRPEGATLDQISAESEDARRIAHELAGRSRWKDRSVDTRELPKITLASPMSPMCLERA